MSPSNFLIFRRFVLNSIGSSRFLNWLRRRFFPLAWSLLWAVIVLACALSLSTWEWSPRLLPLGLRLLVLGGLVPLAFPADALRLPSRTWWSAWYAILVAGAFASLAGWWGNVSGNIFTAGMLAAVLAGITLVTRPKPPLRLAAAWLLFAFAFISWPAPPSLDGSQAAGRQLMSDYGCVLCHREGSQSLMGLPNRLEHRLSTGGKAIASPRAWIYLHLYAPQAFQDREAGPICPPYRSLFHHSPAKPGLPSPWALPVVSPEGAEVLPSAQARLLADYLLSLRTPDAPGGSAGREAAIARGEALFYAKCAVCHGRDAQGDSLNYPPLDDPKWLNLPEEEFLDIAMNGKKGPLVVHGREWDGIMLPPGITDKRDAAAVRLYLRDRLLPTPPATSTPRSSHE